jgi:hypothetical protein
VCSCLASVKTGGKGSRYIACVFVQFRALVGETNPEKTSDSYTYVTAMFCAVFFTQNMRSSLADDVALYDCAISLPPPVGAVYLPLSMTGQRAASSRTTLLLLLLLLHLIYAATGVATQTSEFLADGQTHNRGDLIVTEGATSMLGVRIAAVRRRTLSKLYDSLTRCRRRDTKARSRSRPQILGAVRSVGPDGIN